MTKRLTLNIHGTVQRVGFRYKSSLEAQKLDLMGFVANVPNGQVEIIAEGPENVLKNFLDQCYNGFERFRINNIEISWSRPIGEFSSFVIR